MSKRSADRPLPSVADIRAWLAADSASRPKASAAARAFGIRGMDDRRAFKQLFKKALHGGEPSRDSGPEGLPSVTLFRVVGTDEDGAIRAAPDRWPGSGEPPEVIVEAGGASGRIGVGARLIGRLIDRSDDGERPHVRPIRILPSGQDADAPELALVEADRNGRLSLKAARPGRERYWSIADRPPEGLAEGDLVLVQPLSPRMGPRGRDFRARILSAHGRADDPAAFGLALMASLEAPIAFPEEVEAAAACAEPPTLQGRRDLRETPLLTIDGADARDFDDAVFAEPAGDGWRVIVAIADVALYVRPGSALDQEARLRGNSTYLPDRAIPMLPEALSNGLCSLKPNEDRACLFVEMRFDKSGHRVAANFGRGLMRSHYRLTYEKAAAVGDDAEREDPDPPAYAKHVRRLYGAYACLSRGRNRRAPLELELPERMVAFDAEGAPVAMKLRPSLSSHRLIEEFMVQANASAAEAILAANAEALYRAHDKPDPERMGLLAETAAKLGAAAPGARLDRPSDLNALLARIEDPQTRTILSELILRAQARARYGADCDPHYGLALEAYTHFTSPIRRYADLVAHRALIAALNLGEGGAIDTPEMLEAIADAVNRTERRSAVVERSVLDRYAALMAARHVGETFEGRVVGANRAGLFIRFDHSLLEGFAPAALLPDDFWRLSRDGMAMEGGSGAAIRVGDPVSARIRDADAKTGGVTLEILTATRGARPPKRYIKRRKKRVGRP